MVTHHELNQKLHAAIGAFVSEFAALESIRLMHVLVVLSLDQTLAMCASELLEFHNKLRLIEYMAKERGVSGLLFKDLKTALNAAAKISEKRNIIAHNPGILFLMPNVPTLRNGHALGVSYPLTKRKRTNTGTSARDVAKSAVMEVHEIDALTRKTADLNLRVMKGLIERLDKHKRGVTTANV